MNELNQMPEFTITLKSKVKPSERIKVSSSFDLAKLAKKCFDADTIEWTESFIVIALNACNKVMGFYKISTGGLTGTFCDPKTIFQFALLANATKIVLSHNHPSGSVRPSRADEELTNKLKQAGKVLDIQVADHIIVSPEDSYYSFADEGMM